MRNSTQRAIWYLATMGLRLWFVLATGLLFSVVSNGQSTLDSLFKFKIIDPKVDSVQFFHRNNQGQIYKTFEQIDKDMEKQGFDLLLAFNGGMYLKDFTPQGLYIVDGQQRKKIDLTPKAYGNFYLQPNGVFYIDSTGHSGIVPSTKFEEVVPVRVATQSGPMVLIDGQFNPHLIKGSKNLNLRNGVGILPDGRIIAAISKDKVNFYDFATFFKNHGCENALYLDGFVSRWYEKGGQYSPMQFGVIVGVVGK